MATKAERVAAMERDLFRADEYQDPRSRKRVVPMQVLNMSFPRTSSMSMQAALNTLGYSCYHSVCFFSSILDCDVWNDALDAKFFGKGRLFTLQDWDQLLGYHSAVSADTPAAGFAEELIALYPDAKVILVERDVESWYASFDKGIITSMWAPFINFVADLDPYFVGRLRAPHHRWAKGYMHAYDAEEMRRNARDVYKAHYALVKRITPKERLLEYEIGSGWTPLCEFLDREVPQTPFPHVNDGRALNEMIMLIAKKGLINFARKAALCLLPVVVIGAGWWYSSTIIDML